MDLGLLINRDFLTPFPTPPVCRVPNYRAVGVVGRFPRLAPSLLPGGRDSGILSDCRGGRLS